MPSITASSQQALVHLKKLKPYDGWSLETNSTTKQVRLQRRSVPLTDNYFRDVHYDVVSGNVVGILTKGPPTKAQVLVDSNGKPIGKTPAIVFVTTWKSGPSKKTATTPQRNRPTPATNNNVSALSEAQNQELIRYAVYAVGGAIAVRVLLSAFVGIYLLVLPVVIIYAMQTCPSIESFDAKREIKRVLRGHHLAEDDDRKPKGWLNETLARVQASVTTELATGLGYEVSMRGFINAFMIATVAVPAVNRAYYWVGAFGKWRYFISLELESEPQVNLPPTR